jgi:hypothetical protein
MNDEKHQSDQTVDQRSGAALKNINPNLDRAGFLTCPARAAAVR